MTSVIVTTATKISTKQKDNLESSLAKKYGKDMKIEYRLDERIIGGIKLQVGSLLLDGSVVAKLDKIKTKLLSPVS